MLLASLLLLCALPQDAEELTRKGIAELRQVEADVAAGKVTGLDIAGAFFDVLRRRGIEKSSRCGYPIGLSYPPDWGERTMSLRPGDRTVLEENMTFHFMPGLWFDDWGIEITESIVITANGAVCLANYPRELLVKS